MKHKVGDIMTIKSREWYNRAVKDEFGRVICGSALFVKEMTEFCGKSATIVELKSRMFGFYALDLDECSYIWTDEMFEELK